MANERESRNNQRKLDKQLAEDGLDELLQEEAMICKHGEYVEYCEEGCYDSASD